MDSESQSKRYSMSFTFSQFQNNVFDFAENETGHGIVNAVAGSGKTFTLIETMKRIQGNSLFVAFNKAIADELGRKVPAHVTAATLHSMGLKTITKSLGRTKIDNKKIQFIMNGIAQLEIYPGMKNEEKTEIFRKRSKIMGMISICKATLTDWTNSKDVAKVCDFYGRDFDLTIMGLFKLVFQRSIEMIKVVDFDDMIYFPVAMKLKPTKFDWVFVDEAQDLNRAQIELVLSLIKKPNGRILAVGDPFQSIYGFRGADSEAMSRIKNALEAKELPLSICYRCPKDHINLAKDLVPHIEAADNAPKGEILHVDRDEFVKNVITETNPLVICRINAPLVGYALSMIANGHKAVVRGLDIGMNLVNIVRSIKAKNIDDLFEKINYWQDKEITKLRRRKASESTVDLINDKADAIRLIADTCRDPFHVINTIQNLFSDDTKKGVVLSTVHKAKGLEADAVYIVKPELMPLNRKNQQDWELEQEHNIQYVAYTRAKNRLVFVNE